MRRFSVIAFILYLFATGFTYAAELDNFYLEKFGEQTSPPKTLYKSLAITPQITGVHKCGTPLRKALKSDWNQLQSSTQKILAKYLSKPTYSLETTLMSSSGNFRIHYETNPSATNFPKPAAPYTLNSWVQTVADTFDFVYAAEVANMGYSPPVTPYDIYLEQQPKDDFGNIAFGITTSISVDPVTQSATSFIQIDNDFIESLYQSTIPGFASSNSKALAALQITAAHEFHHAIQYRYNYYFQPWYAEATSSWMEDEVYDSVNQLYDYSINYLQAPQESISAPSDGGYSRWIFNRSVSENHNLTTIKSFWEKLRNTIVTTTNTDSSGWIQMLPVIDSALHDQQSSFTAEFSSFAKRLYTQSWTSHTNELSLLYHVPLTIKATYSAYPVNSSSTVQPTATLPAYSLAYYKFIPSSSAPINLNITLSATGELKVTAFKKTTGNIITEYPLTTNGGALTVDSFGVAGVAEAALVICNPTAAPATVSFSTDGTTPPNPSNSGGGGGGCFIATAAYGSYLHPKVMILRDFRDAYLLTNMPGRLLVAAYYKISPPIAEFISRHEQLRFIIRLLLAPVIFTVEHFWLMLAASSLLTGGFALRLHRRRKFQMCNGIS